MKRFLLLALSVSLILTLTSCSNSADLPSTSESEPALETTTESSAQAASPVQTNGDAVEWLNPSSDDFPWSESLEIQIPEFPDTTFVWTPEKITAVKDGEETELLWGMPVRNAFFADLNGDGFPEICSTVCLGSGIVDVRINVYDYANSVACSLSDRMAFDYELSLEDGSLVVKKSAYSDSYDFTYGTLKMEETANGATLTMINETTEKGTL